MSNDMQYIGGHEYDGSESWKYSTPFVAPRKTHAVESLFVPPSRVGWMTLAEINEHEAT